MTGKEQDRNEREELSRDEARRIAEAYRESGQMGPFPCIPPSLLSATHIRDYVLKTGAISPLYVGGGRRARLKNASYEGRIGRCAYQYNRVGLLERIPLRAELTVGANSIVFVECDLDFRLPDFIALRFNLQIRHVHRGLLLGTGPLVDPGYWGKLCIPLHNLTDEDYSIPLEEGLIWVEFTKTSAQGKGDPILGRVPLDEAKEYWKIKDFVVRAAEPIEGEGVNVPIRSSISKVREKAESAETTAKEAERKASGIAIGAALVATIGLVALAFGFATFIQDAYSSLTPRVDGLDKRFSLLERRVGNDVTHDLLSEVLKINVENEELRGRLANLERVVRNMSENETSGD